MTFRVRKPYDQYFDKLIEAPTVTVDDKAAGLYFLRLNKCGGVDSIFLERVRHNHWIMAKQKPLSKKKELTKYSIFE